MKRHNCHARQESDQMRCVPCGLVWDMNDPEPPECRKNIKRAIARVAKIEEEAATLKSKEPRRFPVMLPEEVAVEIVKTYQANARDGIKGQIAGMQAAYRLFLDRVEL